MQGGTNELAATLDAVRRPLTGLGAAEVISTLGTEMTAVALPWFVLVSTGSPARMGVVLAAEFVGMAVLGLWGGRLAGLLGPRRMMLASDLSRAFLVALIPTLYWTGALSFGVVLVVGLLVGAFFPAYQSAQRLVLAGIVGEDEVRLTRAGGLIGSLNEFGSFAGPALGGLLVAAMGPVNVLVVDAVSYLMAFGLVAMLAPAKLAPPVEEAGNGIVEGLRYLVRHRSLRRQVAGISIVEIGWTAMVATLPVLALHSGGPSVAGWLLASYGAGSVVGGLISTRARTAGGHTTTWAVIGIAVATWVLVLGAVLPVHTLVLAIPVAANGVCAGLFFPRFFSALTTRTPPALRARVMTSVTIAIAVPGPLGFIGAGLLAQRSASPTASLLLVAASATVGAILTVRGLLSTTTTTAVSPLIKEV
jgi:MFS family permease